MEAKSKKGMSIIKKLLLILMLVIIATPFNEILKQGGTSSERVLFHVAFVVIFLYIIKR